MEILNSATKIVLLAMTAALIALTAAQIIDQEVFKNTMLMIFAFYFGQKTNVPIK